MPPKRRAADEKTELPTEVETLHDDIDAERRERIARNNAALAAIGLKAAVEDFSQAIAAKKAAFRANLTVSKAACVRRPRGPGVPLPSRRSSRLAGVPAPAVVELDDNGNPVQEGSEGEQEGPLLDLLGNGHVYIKKSVNFEDLSDEQRAALNARRCSSKSRGGVYDKLGLTCHFCRQKKLCGEESCPRCSTRNSDAECVGKTFCRRCQSSTGIFCRACITVRYGQDLDDVRGNPDWLCPHCYVDVHGSIEKHGWFCNSSICMRGMKIQPTGIAIFKALESGYPSVAHMLQAQMLAKVAERKAKEPDSAALDITAAAEVELESP